MHVPLNFLAHSRNPPVAQWLHFRTSVRKCMAFSPRRGTPFFYSCVQLHLCLFVQSFYMIFQIKSCQCEKSFLRKDIKPA